MTEEVTEATETPAETTTEAVTEAPAGVVETTTEAAPEVSEAPAMDWADMRGVMTGGDDKLEAIFGRYRSADAFAKAFMAQRQKISEGSKPVTLGEDPTEEDVKAYREAVGIPEDVKEYGVNFAEGFELGDGDKEALGSFTEHMHNSNVPPAAAQAALAWYEQTTEATRQAQNEALVATNQESADALKSEWGREFDGNLTAVKSYLDETLGQETANGLREARLMDGSRLMDNADVMRLLVEPAVDRMGPNAIIGGDSGTMSKTLEERKQELMGLRLSDPVKYKTDAVQEELSGIYQRLGRGK